MIFMKEDAIAIQYRDRTSLKARKLHVCECVCTRVGRKVHPGPHGED